MSSTISIKQITDELTFLRNEAEEKIGAAKSEKDLDEVSKKIIEVVKEKTGATIRS